MQNFNSCYNRSCSYLYFRFILWFAIVVMVFSQIIHVHGFSASWSDCIRMPPSNFILLTTQVTSACAVTVGRRNVGWVATCNTVGQTAGSFIGNVVFLTLESADFCNKYIRSQHENYGLVTLAGQLLHICHISDVWMIAMKVLTWTDPYIDLICSACLLLYMPMY